MCGQRKLRSACASAHSDQSLRCPHVKETWYPYLSKMRRMKNLIRLCKCTGLSESSLGAHFRRSFSDVAANLIRFANLCAFYYLQTIAIKHLHSYWLYLLYLVEKSLKAILTPIIFWQRESKHICWHFLNIRQHIIVRIILIETYIQPIKSTLTHSQWSASLEAWSIIIWPVLNRTFRVSRINQTVLRNWETC